MFDWHAYLRLSRLLAAAGRFLKSEAVLRTSISRAYYAAFCVARNRLAHEEQKDPDKIIYKHSKVWKAYKNSSNKGSQSIGKIGVRLKRKRENADYQNTFRSNLPLEVKGALINASQILSDLGKIKRIK